jgi:tetratricopeptide (TPR) repeat protein
LFPIGAIMAERFLYLPSIAMAACVVLAVCAAGERLGQTKPARVVLGAAVVVLAARTWVRNADWRDNLTLSTATVRSSPRSFKSHKLLAAALYESHGEIGGVIAEAEQSLAILDPLPDAKNNADSYRRAAGYYLDKGDYRRSRELLQRAIQIVSAMDWPAGLKRRSTADLDRAMAGVRLRLGDSGSALDAARSALAAEPLAAGSYGQMAAALVAAGRAGDAAVLLMQGVLLTGDARLRQALVELYRRDPDPQACAILPGSTALNQACAMVHRHLCEASLGAIRVWLAAGRMDSARKMKISALHDFGCAAGPLDAALPDR